MHGPCTSGPSPVAQSTSVAWSFRPATRRFAVQRQASLLVRLGQRHEMLGGMLAPRAVRAPDVLAVHHHLAERDVRGPGRLPVARDDRVVARLDVGRRSRREVAQIAVDGLVEVEPGLDEAGEEVGRGDVAGRGEVRDELLHVPLVAPRRRGPLFGRERVEELAERRARSAWTIGMRSAIAGSPCCFGCR